jgi:hypothetical protein
LLFLTRKEAHMKLLLALSCSLGLLGCTAEVDDSMYITGTEEGALHGTDGTWSCESPKKVLICHIPPGNPDNAHTICVGEAAVDPHQRLHGDTIGACGDDGGGGDGDVPDAGTDTPPDVPQIN